ncbi:MAG: Lrp/AsnC family transcriptional regulator [Kiritimatiellae bacterium]|nr:Lrp/AsnC family transcriptional regulator [Kiritimatiellia bacterium]
MDNTDRRIAGLLAGDGRMSNREIGRKLGVSEGTVRQRLGRLVSDGTLRVTAELNLDHLDEGYLAIIGVRIDGRHLEEHAEKLKALPNVLSTVIVTGRFDILVTVVLNKHQDLVDFVTRSLSRVKGVLDSETFIVLKSHDVWVPAGSVTHDR